MVKYEIKEASTEIRVEECEKLLKNYRQGCAFQQDDVYDEVVEQFDNLDDAKEAFSKRETLVRYMESAHNLGYYLVTEYQLEKVLYDENEEPQEFEVLEITLLPLIWKNGNKVEDDELSSIYALYNKIGADHEWEDLQYHIFSDILTLNTGRDGKVYVWHLINNRHDYCNAICPVGTENVIENNEELIEELFY